MRNRVTELLCIAKCKYYINRLSTCSGMQRALVRLLMMFLIGAFIIIITTVVIIRYN